jgi:N-acetyl-anhydromuramyl-L-alanine amidase AmpD
MNIARIPLPAGRTYLKATRGVIHCMAEFVSFEGQEYYAPEFLRMKGWSAHKFCTPSGTIIRCRENNQGAYHAAARGHNKISLGFEFLVAGVHDYESFIEAIKKPYLTEAQYDAGVKDIRKDWIEKEGILDYVRHSIIDPLKKQDPGVGFPWDDFILDIGVAI